jgi:hypothetical protein
VPQPQVVRVTSAARSHTEDIALRQRRYVQMQSLRVLCVLTGCFVPGPVWMKLVIFAGAVFLPWFGVVMANAGPTKERAAATAMVAHGSLEEPVRIAIEPGRVVDGER